MMQEENRIVHRGFHAAEYSTKYIMNLKNDEGFFKRFWQTHVLLWGHWYTCLGFLVMSPLGFKARVGSALFAFLQR